MTAAQQGINWEPCANDDCRGVRLSTTNTCWAHTYGEPLNAALQRFGQDGKLDARGVPITADLLQRILAAAPHDHQGNPVLAAVDFEQATFKEWAEFSGATFQEWAQFSGATFQGMAVFDRATFQGIARFDRATFQEPTWFGRATFQGIARFDRATFQERTAFDEATFEGDARFERATFQGEARFDRPTFQGVVRFGEATFQERTAFDKATFEGDAWFIRTTFKRDAEFGGATFKGDAWFIGATFKGVAWLVRQTFQKWAWFNEATFEGAARFDEVTFKRQAHLDSTTFKREVSYSGATFHSVATFNGAIFEQARHFGPLLVARRLDLNDVVFHTWVQLEVAAPLLRMGRTQFVGGAQLRVRWASIVLDDASLTAPSILAGVPPFKDLDERPFKERWARQQPPGRPPAEQCRPRLLTLVRTDVAGLRIANVDLRACRFVGAHNLDKLRIEATPQLALPPPGWHLRRVGGEGLPIWRWATRLTLAEEQQWRSKRELHPTPAGQPHPQLRGWYPPACRPSASLVVRPPAVPAPVELAALYRELRKGREDAKDEPGAADFYYGEMEMRRHSPATPRAERLIEGVRDARSDGDSVRPAARVQERTAARKMSRTR